MLQYALYASYGGTMIADYSHRARDVTIATNNRGYAECHAFIPLGLQESFQLYDISGVAHVRVTDEASVYEGRLEDVNIVDGGVELVALGYSRALSDVPYTAFWTGTDMTDWRPVNDLDNPTTMPNRRPKMYAMDTQQRVYIGLTKNAVYANAADVGAQAFIVPDDSVTGIVGFECTFSMLLPTNWQFRIYTWTAGFGASTLQYNTPGNGSLLTGVVRVTFTSAPIIEMSIFNNTGANYTYTGESGANYAQLTTARWVAATTNQINTTLTIARAAGVAALATVGSTAGMYVGQTLYIGGAEAVTVLSIGNSTQFSATFTQSHIVGTAVRAFIIYADEIAKHLISQTNFYNSAQLSSSTALVQSPALDLLNESYEDQLPADILDYLVALGDNQSTPRLWEWGVYEAQRLYLRARASAGRTWYIDISSIDISRTLDSLYVNVYAVYEVNGTTYRTPTNGSARYSIFRQLALSVNTNSTVQAYAQRDAALNDLKDPIPRSSIELTQVFDAYGARWPLDSVRSGDTIVIRNLPPTLSVALDRIRTFVVSRTTYDIDADTLSVEPELPRATLDGLLAQLAAGVGKAVSIGLNLPRTAAIAVKPPRGGGKIKGPSKRQT